MSNRHETLIELVAHLAERGQAIYLGHEHGAPFFASVRESAVLVGPPGSGKTSGVFVPSVACHPGPVIVTSVRQQGRDPGVREATFSARSAIAEHYGGDVMELAVDDRFGFVAHPVWWDFTEGCDDWNVALRRAKSLARAGIRATLENHHNWRTWVAELLAPLLFNAAVGGDRSDAHVANIVANGGGGEHDELRADPSTIHGQLAELDGLVEAGTIPVGHPSVTLLRKYCGLGGLHEETREGTFTLAASDVLSYFAYDPPSVELYLIDLGAFLRSHGTLYITAGHGQAEDVRMIIAALLEAVEQTWVSIPYEERPASVLFALDEVATVAPIPSLPNAVGTYGGSGIQLLLGFQHSTQASEPWGSSGPSVVNGGNHLMLFPGLDDTGLMERFVHLSPRVETHDREISVVGDLAVGARQADATRLISERTELENVRASAPAGLEKQYVARAASQLLRRRYPTIVGRLGDTAEALLREVLDLTVSTPKSLYRSAIDSSVIFSAPHGSAFLKSGNRLRLIDLAPYFHNPYWLEHLSIEPTAN